MKYNVPEPSEICMSAEQLQRFFGFLMDDDLAFYDEYTINLTGEEQEKFFRDNPDFMSGFELKCDAEREMECDVKCDRMALMKERIYREIMRKISELKDGG